MTASPVPSAAGLAAFEPKILGFLCTWCSYTGADLAGTARLHYPSNLRAVRVPCSGRVAPELILRAFDQGADGVLVLGCHIGECHYDNGNHRTAKRVPVLKALLSFAGLEPERLRLDWVSASEATLRRLVGVHEGSPPQICTWRLPSPLPASCGQYPRADPAPGGAV
jgi:coenzyme F420-reducing hydrogenase delta subunit